MRLASIPPSILLALGICTGCSSESSEQSPGTAGNAGAPFDAGKAGSSGTSGGATDDAAVDAGHDADRTDAAGAGGGELDAGQDSVTEDSKLDDSSEQNDSTVDSEPTGQCTSSTSCGQNESCDPQTLSCATADCDPTNYQSCSTYPNEICVRQANDVGACYTHCTPFSGASTCEANAYCVPKTDDEVNGLCFRTGTNAPGAKCSAASLDTATDCVSGAACANFGTPSVPDYRCVKFCQFFSKTPTGCAQSELCMPGSVCVPESLGFYDEVGVGEPCTLGDYFYCGLEDGKLVGICDDFATEELRCDRFCRLSQLNADCPNGFECVDSGWEPGLGTCQPTDG